MKRFLGICVLFLLLGSGAVLADDGHQESGNAPTPPAPHAAITIGHGQSGDNIVSFTEILFLIEAALVRI